MISKKIYNDEYAPGIATYGINGKTGDQGANGNSIFYTSFDIYNNTGNSMEMFIQKIRNKMLPVLYLIENIRKEIISLIIMVIYIVQIIQMIL